MIREKLLNIVAWIRQFIREKFQSENEDLPFYATILISGIFFVVALNGFVELTDELAEGELTAIDESVTSFITSFRSPILTSIFTFATHLGDRYAYLAVTLLMAGYFYFRRRSWTFIIQTGLVLILATVSNIVLKEIINRERPAIEHLVTVNTLSYPSGHSMSAMAFYGFLIYLCIHNPLATWLRYVLIGLLVLLILSIGISRIYLGVHFPTDVAAGFIGGLIWVAFCAVLFNVFELWRKRRDVPAR